jgi:hypothetical protein
MIVPALVLNYQADLPGEQFMRKLLLWIIAASSLSAGSAFADFYNVTVAVYDNSGALFAPESPLIMMSLVSTPSSSLLPPKIRLNLASTSANPAATVTIASANYARIVDFHRQLQTAIQSGGVMLGVRVSPPFNAFNYNVNLDTNIVTITQIGY